MAGKPRCPCSPGRPSRQTKGGGWTTPRHRPPCSPAALPGAASIDRSFRPPRRRQPSKPERRLRRRRRTPSQEQSNSHADAQNAAALDRPSRSGVALSRRFGEAWPRSTVAAPRRAAHLLTPCCLRIAHSEGGRERRSGGSKCFAIYPWRRRNADPPGAPAGMSNAPGGSRARAEACPRGRREQPHGSAISANRPA